MAPSELSHYRVVEPLGAGGMGVVYRAIDTRLNRTVAIKVISANLADAELRRRFLKEARAASAFSHPNIVTIHEVDTAGDVDFIVMELLSGRSLDKWIAPNGLPIDEVLSFAEQIASALAAAHAAGIVHRDLKPANVMVSDAGHVKLLDFGIAKQLAAPSGADAATLTVVDPTAPGVVVGSVPYMSPEQAQGHAVDGRSDVFAFGVLVYELLTGRRPFSGTTSLETVAKILEATPPSVEAIRNDVPVALATLVSSCLEKDRNRRPAAAALHAQLSALRRARATSTVSLGGVLGRRAVAVPAILLLAIAAGTGWWWWESGRELREARRRLPDVLALAELGDGYAFYPQAAALMRLLPEEAQLRAAWNNMTFQIPLKSDPPGAEVLVKGYSAPEDDWVPLGRTPIEQASVPRGIPRIRFLKDGYVPYDGTVSAYSTNAVLDRVGSVPEGMVRVPRGTAVVEGHSLEVPDFFLDRFEVTNRQYKAFVDAGGYTKPEFWNTPFIENDRALSREEAMAKFRDRTGRPGASTWELGTYPAGQADFPVSGVSWYEAAAFAVYAGKSLPTAFQWRLAADFLGPSGVYGDILLTSNFNGKGPVGVGSLRSIGVYGQYDMAGNVKEWCWTETRGGRMILGGGWNEPKYMYEDRDAQPPLGRHATYGFRLVKNIDPQPAAAYLPVASSARDYTLEKPIDDAGFAIVKGLYDYDPRPLNHTLDTTEDAADWRRETVSFDAAYGSERVVAYVYVPKSAAPPYQVVIYFPGGDATLLPSSRVLNLTNVDFVIRSGRALVYPVYQGTFERGVKSTGPNSFRDVTIARVKDFRRVVEYLATRSDLDSGRLGYYGVSLGAYTGTMINALEPRIKATVFMGGGLARVPRPAEVDTLNFVPRMRAPTLMVNGNSDFQYPLETTQLPEFRLLNLPPDRKRHALFEGGHMPNQIHDVMREILDWFDKFLGPVKTAANNGTN
jgi:predicted Ser/Thr protein kinase